MFLVFDLLKKFLIGHVYLWCELKNQRVLVLVYHVVFLHNFRLLLCHTWCFYKILILVHLLVIAIWDSFCLLFNHVHVGVRFS